MNEQRTMQRERAPAVVRELHGGGWAVRAARRGVFAQLSRAREGSLHVRDAFGEAHFGASSAAAPAAHLVVHDASTYVDLVTRGTVGAGEAFMRGAWSSGDLTALVRFFVRNRDVMRGLDGGLASLAGLALKAFHRRRDNTRSGSRTNIAEHYDFGNAWYELFLDDTWTYSSAVFERPDATLGEAQRAKLERVCAKLSLGERDRVIEIGAGWGGFALHAAATRGCHVTTTTISREQYEFTRERVERAGLAGRVHVLFEDYRELRGRYDKLVSIEMIEAVGERWFDAYFAKIGALLEPHGLALLQAITIRDQLYESALRSVDFIQRHIFPGSCIPAVHAITERVARVTDMKLVQLEDIGAHYARTLRTWRERLAANAPRARALGYDDATLRKWEFYFAYCEGGFEERVLGTVQALFAKRGWRAGLPLLPLR